MFSKFTKSSFVFAVVVVLFVTTTLSFVSCTEDHADGDKAVPESNVVRMNAAGNRKRSIFQACRKDIESLCMTKPKEGQDAAHARRLSLRNAASCLEDKEEQVQEDTCKKWLHARSTCFTDTEKEGVCPQLAAAANKKGDDKKSKVTLRGKKMMCIRSVDPAKLSQECVESDFYKAIIGLKKYHKAKEAKLHAKKERVEKLLKKMDS